MSDKLVKEIITTTTERFNDGGSIKEKITESREKVYSTFFSEEQIKKAEVVDKDEKPAEKEENKEGTTEDLVKAAAENIDKQYQPSSQAFVPTQIHPQPQMAPQYNVVNRNPNQAPQSTKFPWEQ